MLHLAGIRLVTADRIGRRSDSEGEPMRISGSTIVNSGKSWL